MRRRIALDGLTDDAIPALPALAAHPDVELVRIYDADARVWLRRLALLEPRAAALLQRLLSDDPRTLADLEILSPAEAIALCPGPAPAEQPDAAHEELLQAIRDVADAVELAAAPDSLFARLLDVAVTATGATGGSLLLVEDAALRVRAAAGLEPELWPKVQSRIGTGLAGRAWAEARPFTVSGRADPAHFEIVHERHDVASALLTPLAHAGSVLGVLCLHHATRPDHFAALDLEWAAGLGAALARVAETALTTQAAARAAERSALAELVERALGAATLPAEIDIALCRLAADHTGGTATLWRSGADGDTERLRFAASSLPGGGLGAPTELQVGQGLDGRAARTREPLFLREADRLAYAALPLLGPDAALLGLLAVQCGERARPAAEHEHALRAIASEAAAVLARNAAAARARDRNLRAEALLEAATEIASLRDPDRIAQALAARATLLCEAAAVFVRVLDPARGRHRLAIPQHAAESHAADRLTLDRRAAGEALRRRAPIEVDPDAAAATSGVLALPILAGDRALGIISLHIDAPQRFDAAIRAAATRLAAFAAIALEAALAAPAPGPADGMLSAAAFDQRLDAELARAAEAEDDISCFSLVSCEIENAAALGATTTSRALRAAARALAEQLRPFDAAAVTGEASLLILLPAPGPAPAERITRLARTLAEAVAKDPDATSVALAFGHATVPGDALRKTDLLARAAEARIRML